MKQFKRFISVLLSALMTAAVLTALPFAASAASDIYVITGDSVWLDGWNPQPTENVMTRKADGTYAITVKNVLSYDENYQLQVVRFIGGDKNRKEWYGANGTTYNYDFRVTADCDVTVAFDPSTKTIAASGKGVAEAEYPIEKLVAVGSGKDGFLNNVSWGLNAEANEMKETAKGVYRLVCDSVRANRSYQVKFAANGSWMMNWGYDGAAEVRLNEANPALYNSPTNITFTPVSKKDYVRLDVEDRRRGRGCTHHAAADDQAAAHDRHSDHQAAADDRKTDAARDAEADRQADAARDRADRGSNCHHAGRPADPDRQRDLQHRAAGFRDVLERREADHRDMVDSDHRRQHGQRPVLAFLRQEQARGRYDARCERCL